DGARLGQGAGALGLAVEPIARGAEHRDDDSGGDRAPGEKAKESDHARTETADTPCPALCRVPTSFLSFGDMSRRGWPGQARPRGFWDANRRADSGRTATQRAYQTSGGRVTRPDRDR